MPAWLAPALSLLATGGMGVLGFKGQKDTNAANARQAREQMDFQERMSSTAAQRAVDDYRKAGLNPALAYDRGASSPGGAAAIMGNALASGVSSAQSARQLNQALKFAAEQHELDKLNKTADIGVKTRQGALLDRQMEAQSLANTHTLFALPFMNRQVAAETMMKELALPGLRNTASFEELMGMAGKGLFSAKTAAEILKLFRK